MYKHIFKRLIDILVSFVILVCMSPFLLLVIFFLHYLNKGAGVFFPQIRPGKGGRVFKMYKFKTMTDERDSEGRMLPDNLRMTKLGKYIRLASIDELPQLVNVLKGDMSLIGPRPLLPRYYMCYSEREQLRHSVRPGITGWAQVNGRNTVCWDSRLEQDVYYVRHLSFKMDVLILLRTIWNVFNRKGVVAVPNGIFKDLDVERCHPINKEELEIFLHEIDDDFVNPLSSRVDIRVYSERIVRNSKMIYERDNMGEIKGIVAVYVFDDSNDGGFITLVATKAKYRKQGVAKRLMVKTINYCKAAGKNKIDLCAYTPVAVNFYKTMGFEITQAESNGKYNMRFNIV